MAAPSLVWVSRALLKKYPRDIADYWQLTLGGH